MTSDSFDQSSLRRACIDTAQAIHTFTFWLIELAIGGLTGALGAIYAPQFFSGVLATAVQYGTGIGGMLIVVCIVFLGNLHMAPYRQRNEVRTALQAQLDLRTQPKHPNPSLYLTLHKYEFGTSKDIGFPKSNAIEGKWLRAFVLFSIMPTMLVESIALEVLGRRLRCHNWQPEKMHTDYGRDLYFEIPEWINAGEHIVQLIALADGIEWGSEKVAVDFPPCTAP